MRKIPSKEARPDIFSHFYWLLKKALRRAYLISDGLGGWRKDKVQLLTHYFGLSKQTRTVVTWLAPWTKSRSVIGYPSGQGGAILPARDFSLGLARSKIIFWCFITFNKSFIDQACSVKMAGYWPRSFSGPRPWTRKKRTWPISSHLDRTSLVNNPYIQ